MLNFTTFFIFQIKFYAKFTRARSQRCKQYLPSFYGRVQIECMRLFFKKMLHVATFCLFLYIMFLSFQVCGRLTSFTFAPLKHFDPTALPPRHGSYVLIRAPLLGVRTASDLCCRDLLTEVSRFLVHTLCYYFWCRYTLCFVFSCRFYTL
jgi:hypothetical protein